jgi:hypothetical protein
MEPAMHTGDLVIVRKASEYQIGDIVAVDNAQLRSTVLHRIIAVENGRFILQGDNNDFVDTFRARPEDIVGRRWILIGEAGRLVELVRTPVGAAVLVMLIAGIAMSGNKKRKKKRSGALVEAPTTSWLHGSRGPTMVTAGAAALAFATLGAFAFTEPTVHTATAKIPYTETGRFTYSGPAERGPVYPTGRVSTGQPIYLELVDDLDLTFDYSLKTDSAHDVGGTGSLTAELSDGNGWSREFPLAPASEFDSGSWNVSGVMHLREVRHLVDRVQKATGVFRDFYTLNVVPHVEVDGTIDERPFSSKFTPSLSFQVGALEMQVATDTSTTSATPVQGDALRPSQGGAVIAPLEAANSLSFLGIALDVAKARWVAGAGTVLSLLLVALVGLTVRSPKRDEPALIQARYGRFIVPVESVSSNPNASVVEVTEIESLVALARRYDRAVLHESNSHGHRYVVENEGTIYSYTSVPSVDVHDAAGLDDEPAREQVRA